MANRKQHNKVKTIDAQEDIHERDFANGTRWREGEWILSWTQSRALDIASALGESDAKRYWKENSDADFLSTFLRALHGRVVWEIDDEIGGNLVIAYRPPPMEHIAKKLRDRFAPSGEQNYDPDIEQRQNKKIQELIDRFQGSPNDGVWHGFVDLLFDHLKKAQKYAAMEFFLSPLCEEMFGEPYWERGRVHERKTLKGGVKPVLNYKITVKHGKVVIEWNKNKGGKEGKCDLIKLSIFYAELHPLWKDVVSHYKRNRSRRNWRTIVKAEFPDLPDNLIERLSRTPDVPEDQLEKMDKCEPTASGIAYEHAARKCGAEDWAFSTSDLRTRPYKKKKERKL